MNKRQKKKQVKMRNKQLIKRYPFLMPRNVWTDKLPKDYDYTYTEYDCLNQGWRIGFGELLLEELREACIKHNYLDKLRIHQWKEKYASMRLYINGAPPEVHNIIHKYEFISEHICIQCGSPEAVVVNDYGWYLPMCKCCWDKNNQRRELKGYGIKPWEEVADVDIAEFPNSYTVIQMSKEGNEYIVYDISETAKKIRQKYKKRKRKRCS